MELESNFNIPTVKSFNSPNWKGTGMEVESNSSTIQHSKIPNIPKIPIVQQSNSSIVKESNWSSAM